MSEAGSLIGPYRLLSQLGAGAMGEVWRARDERLDRYVAIKLLPRDQHGDPERRARMLREARAAAGVPHGNVVTLFDIVTEGETDVLVMELVEGRTVSETLRKEGPPAIREALAWLIDVTDALAAAHARGILHRDIKSANLMVTPERAIKVLDFGLAKLRDDPTVSIAPAPVPRTSRERKAIALDETMASEPGPGRGPDAAELDDASRVSLAATTPGDSSGSGSDGYQTRAGALLGTPMYMAPEQLDGHRPDERSEVFSVGVVGFELLTGKPPYSAKTVDELFGQILEQPLPPWPDRVPGPVREVLEGALRKDRDARTPTMAALRDALIATRDALFAPPRRRWPLAVALIAGAAVAAGATWMLVRRPHHVDGPGDAKVRRALEEYDVFQTDQALSSLRGALQVAPDHPLAHAYLILFGGGSAGELDQIAAEAAQLAAKAPARSKTRALLEAAVALRRVGPAAAGRALAEAGATRDRELAFWAAELAYRGGDYETARAGFAALVDAGEASFRGRIYDHYSSVLIYADRPDEAVHVGKLYRDKFLGEADGAGVYATTLAVAGRFDEAKQFAQEALGLAEGEDTLAGLGKVLAMAGDLPGAEDLYRRAVDRAPDRRRPIRRAGLAIVQWAQGHDDDARATVAPCLPGGRDAAIHERGACLFVAGVVDPAATAAAITALDGLAGAATDLAPAYGDPASLAGLLRAHQVFDGGGCLRPGTPLAAPAAPADDAVPGDAAAPAAPARRRRTRRPRRPAPTPPPPPPPSWPGAPPGSSSSTTRRPTSTPSTTCRSSPPGPRASAPPCTPPPATAPAPSPPSSRSRPAPPDGGGSWTTSRA
ncbi:MAG: protein kinase [Kofleriaceae bacterium]|nr:protein kinase [Kofleriaceae bacterium]